MEFAQLKRLPTEMKLITRNVQLDYNHLDRAQLDYDRLDHDQLDYEPLLTHIETKGETKKYELIQNACRPFESMKIFFMMHSNRDYWKEFIAVRLIHEIAHGKP
jgi:hypothetical protein